MESFFEHVGMIQESPPELAVARDQVARKYADRCAAAGVAWGECLCGCGYKTDLFQRTLFAEGHVKGQPHLFVAGHSKMSLDSRKQLREDYDALRAERGIAYGRCLCGCGQKTALATRTDLARGDIEEEPVKYVRGHVLRKSPIDYTEEDRGHDTLCWVWQLARNDDGYGQMTVMGKTVYAHRVFYERAHGAIPNGYPIDHLCRVPPCVNPEHLEAVTSRQNYLRGKRAAKLSRREAREIRALSLNGHYSNPELALMYGIGRKQVWRIQNGESWKDLWEKGEGGAVND